MASGRFSTQTSLVLVTFASAGSGWRYGYDLAKETGLKSGTLYPILIRLADRGLVEACWEDGQPAGRPRRHLYRLTANGVVAAQDAQAKLAAVKAPRPAAARRLGPAVEGA